MGGNRQRIARPLWQYDYGQKLLFADLELPAAYEVHFSNTEFDGTAPGVIGNADGADIPDALLETGKDVFAWVFLHSGADDGETRYSVKIPVKRRPQPSHEEPTPVQQNEITQFIAALNDGVTRAEAAQEAAEGFAQSAEEDAHNAAQSASDAAQSARNASASEQSVAQNAESAQASASNAATSERNALASQQAAARSEAAAYAAMNNAHMVNFAVEDGFLVLYKSENLSDLTFELDNGNLVLVQEVV
jgi:hypothetical protein